MNIFYDFEFHEYDVKHRLSKKTTKTIDLISIGMVNEKGETFYAISNEFDLKAAWQNKWLRENVLAKIHQELLNKGGTYLKTYHWYLAEFTLKGMRNLLRWYGSSLAQIRNCMCAFIYGYEADESGMGPLEIAMKYELTDKTQNPVFYGYFSAYDWVVMCQLFGGMLNTPKGFPMYCYDIKQIMDQHGLTKQWKDENCPDPANEHNALADAIWNKKLFETIQSHGYNLRVLAHNIANNPADFSEEKIYEILLAISKNELIPKQVANEHN